MPTDITKIIKAGDMLPPSIADAWFGPGNPIPPIAPPGTDPRTRNYRYNENIQYSPRKYSGFTYEQMRALADTCYPLRIIMERFKSRIASHEWEFRLRPEPGEPKESVNNRSWKDARIRKLTKLFELP